MLSKNDFISSVQKEIDIIKHLYVKIPSDAFDFKPTENQRTTLELLRYLSMCGIASTDVLLHDSDWKLWKPYAERAASMTAEQFCAAMDEQGAEMKKMIEAIPEKDFHSRMVKHPAGEEMLLGIGLIRMPYSWLVAYRMQLFLYLKQLGIDIGTSNNWRGKDRTPPVAK
ncbi:MAG TPA: hypothetical protein VL651_03940 [Bacteroidia bacterium]|nr:hypothetical protein [Bacteroidia bacterium]